MRFLPMKYLLALILVLAPTFAFAATLTWPEYYDFVDILNNEIVYIKKLKVNKNLVLAVMEEAEKRNAKLLERYAGKTYTRLDYAAKRKDLFDKVRSQ